jgi:hypothetical protein
MKQVGARHDIIREWRSLPKEQRQTDQQAEAFAMHIKDKYKFSNDSADQYQTVRGWLLSYLSLTRGNAKDKGETPDDEKSTDLGLSAAERKALRVREAQEAIADHEEAQTAFHENRERLRKERLVREATEGPMLAPTPELPDDTPIERVLFSTRILNALRAADLKTVGEVREISDETLISLPDFGKGSISDLRKKLGLPSTDGLDHWAKSPPDLLI